MIDMDEKEAAAVTGNDGTDWASLASSSIATTPRAGGIKRKRGWITNLPSQRHTGRKTARRGTPKKRAAGGGARGRRKASSTPARAAPAARRQVNSNLMPVPGPSTTRW